MSQLYCSPCEKIEMLEKQIKRLDKSVAEATEVRKDEHMEFAMNLEKVGNISNEFAKEKLKDKEKKAQETYEELLMESASARKEKSKLMSQLYCSPCEKIEMLEK